MTVIVQTPDQERPSLRRTSLTIRALLDTGNPLRPATRINRPGVAILQPSVRASKP